MKSDNKTLGVLAALLSLALASCTQDDASDTRARPAGELDPRFRHAVHYLASARHLAAYTRAERKAAALQRDLIDRTRRAIASKRPVNGMGGAARAWTEAEQRLDALIGDARQVARADLLRPKEPTAITAIAAACLDASTQLRRATGPLHTEIEALGRVPACDGDIVGDALVPRYCHAVAADDVPAARAAAGAIQRQMSCMSTRQLLGFEEAFVTAIAKAERAMLGAGKIDRRANTFRERFRQATAPLVFLVADATRHLGHESMAARWLRNNRALFVQSARAQHSIARRLGLIVHDRYSGRLFHITGECAGDPLRPGADCNALAAYYDAVELLCDAAHWVPSGRAPDPLALICDPDCAGLPTAGPMRGVADLDGPDLPGGTGDATGGRGDGCGLAGGGGEGGNGGGVAGGGAFGQQQCSPGMITGSFGEPNPAQAYNTALTQCLLGMASELRDLPLVPQEGFRPSGGPECFVADGGTDGDPDDVPTQDANLAAAKEIVKAIIGAVAEVVNLLAGEEVITEEGLAEANAVIDNASLGEVSDDCEGGPCEGETSPDGKTITIRGSSCDDPRGCTLTLLHESLHSALTLSSGTTADEDHALIGTEAGDVSLLIALAMSGTTRDCAPDTPSCGTGCTEFDAMAPSCTESALDAYVDVLRQMEEDAESCATDACWNPMNEDFGDTEDCAPQLECVGQMVALCPEDNPDCMCHDRGEAPSAAQLERLRASAWQSYCTRALDERCDSPAPPEGFLGNAGGPEPQPGVTQGGRPGLTVSGAGVVVGTTGEVFVTPELMGGDGAPVP